MPIILRLFSKTKGHLLFSNYSRNILPEPTTETGLGSWYYHPFEPSTLWLDRINSYYSRHVGWIANVYIDSEGHRVVRLKRASDTAKEGVFTCHIPGDMSNPISVEIYHPSELRSRQHFFDILIGYR